jgi:hypothetical protein
MADLQFYIDHARHPCGPNFRIYTEPSMPAPDLEVKREPPPSSHEVRLALLHVGCVSVGRTARGIAGCHPNGYLINATESPGGWLLTGGPYELLNYGVPDSAALERFPEVLASINEHARTLKANA